ncbi:MAG: RNA 2',3'-cyclic phosphodiesterase [Deltaproteobacteria bacterium]
MKDRRLFLAIDLPSDAKETCGLLAQRLKKGGADVAWVAPDNFHLTLKFLGGVAEDRLPRITDACAAVCRLHPPFSFSLEGLGAFPSINAPRVLWAGIATRDAALEKLAADLEAALSALGFEKEDRPFHAHVTLGRVRSPRGRVFLMEALQKEKSACTTPDIPARCVTLFESTLAPASGPTARGALYTALAALPLKT